MLDAGLQPHIFDAKSDVGGLWAVSGKSHFTGPGRKLKGRLSLVVMRCLWTILETNSIITPTMRTNLSRWTCSFSDLAWKEEHFEAVENMRQHGYSKSQLQ